MTEEMMDEFQTQIEADEVVYSGYPLIGFIVRDNHRIVKVGKWNGYALGGVILFNVDTKEVTNPITYDSDDQRKTIDEDQWDDATDEEYFDYRLSANVIKVGDMVEIVSGLKMKGEIKQVSDIFTYGVKGTYGKADTKYCAFSDGSKVQLKHCQLRREN